MKLLVSIVFGLLFGAMVGFIQRHWHETQGTPVNVLNLKPESTEDVVIPRPKYCDPKDFAAGMAASGCSLLERKTKDGRLIYHCDVVKDMCVFNDSPMITSETR